jgi:hypothetical protein
MNEFVIKDKEEQDYALTQKQIKDFWKKKDISKTNISDILSLLDYNDLLTEIEHLLVKAEYQARELYVYYKNETERLYSNSMLIAEKEKRQSTYAKNQASIDSAKAQTLTDLWEIRYKKMRDTKDSIVNEIFNKQSRYKYLMMDEKEAR